MKTKETAVKTPAESSPEEFSNMVNLMAVYSEASNRLEDLQTSCNGQYLELIDEHKSEYAALQATLTESESALETVALKHPEWFGDKRRSIKTPYGTVKFHRSAKLTITDEEKAILKLKLHAKDNPAFKLTDFVAEKEHLNLEALEKLDDAELGRFGIVRVQSSNFSVVPAKVDMGKAVRASSDAAPDDASERKEAA
jgi:hypothetical protein